MGLPAPIDHVMVTAGAPRYVRLMDIEFEEARIAISEHLLLALWVARNAARKVRPGGALLLWAAPAAAVSAWGSGSCRR